MLLAFLSCYSQVVTPLINAQGVSKTYGILPLFQNIAFTVSEGDRIGVIGPNGSGKSTLMQILCGIVQPDSGEVAVRKRTRFGYVAQNSKFEPGETVAAVVQPAEQLGLHPVRSSLAGRARFDYLLEIIR